MADRTFIHFKNLKFSFFSIGLMAFLGGALLLPAFGKAQAPAENQSPLMTAEELKFLDKARKRSYPGGRDEESLKVQAQLPVPTRKMAPATEAPVESGAVTPSGSDD